MKSNLFNSSQLGSIKSKETPFIRDLAMILSQSDIDLNKIFKNRDLIRYNELKTERKRKEFFTDLNERTNVQEQTVQMLYALLFAFIELISDYEDSPEDIASDFIERELIPEDNKSKLTIFITKAFNYRTTFLENKKKRSTLTGVFPRFKGIGNTLEYRAVIENEFYIGDKISDYQPVIKGFLPIASIVLKNDFDEKFHFQATESDLEDIINQLESIMKQINSGNKIQKEFIAK